MVAIQSSLSPSYTLDKQSELDMLKLVLGRKRHALQKQKFILAINETKPSGTGTRKRKRRGKRNKPQAPPVQESPSNPDAQSDIIIDDQPQIQPVHSRKGKERAVDSPVQSFGSFQSQSEGPSTRKRKINSTVTDTSKRLKLTQETVTTAAAAARDTPKSARQQIVDSMSEWPLEDLEMRYIYCRAVIDLLQESAGLESRLDCISSISQPAPTASSINYRGFKSVMRTCVFRDTPPFTMFHMEMLKVVYKMRKDCHADQILNLCRSVISTFSLLGVQTSLSKASLLSIENKKPRLLQMHQPEISKTLDHVFGIIERANVNVFENLRYPYLQGLQVLNQVIGERVARLDDIFGARSAGSVGILK